MKCKGCGNTADYWNKYREKWGFKKSHHRSTLKSATLMENNRLPYQHWFISIHFLTTTKKSFSVKEIQRQLGHNRHEPIWAMLHQTRAVMEKLMKVIFKQSQLQLIKMEVIPTLKKA